MTFKEENPAVLSFLGQAAESMGLGARHSRIGIPTLPPAVIVHRFTTGTSVLLPDKWE